MKEPVQIAKSPQILLEKFILPNLGKFGSRFLSNSKPLSGLNLSPREIFGLCLLAYVGQYFSKEEWTISSDPYGRDGIIYCKSGSREGLGIPIEQVFIPKFAKNDLTEEIIKSIEKKNKKGKEYGRGYGLLVFSDQSGSVDVHKIIPVAHQTDFESVWHIAKANPNHFDYYVALLKSKTDPLGQYVVKINSETGSGKLLKLEDYTQ